MKRFLVFAPVASAFIAACRKEKTITPNGDALLFITSKTDEVNPSGFAPLTAMVILETVINTKVHVKVTGKNGTASDVIHEFEDISNSHSLPIPGLYGGYDNQLNSCFAQRE